MGIATGIGLVVLVAVCCLLSFAASLERTGWLITQDTNALAAKPDAVLLHTYIVNKRSGQLTLRGRLVAEAAVAFCARWKVPLCITAGNASGFEKSDAQIFARYARAIDPGVRIVLGEDATVQSTSEEIREMQKLMRRHGWSTVDAFALTPHLKRASGHWAAAMRDGWQMRGADGPFYYALWEAMMVPAEWALPPNSRRRTRLLGIVRGLKSKSAA